MRSFRVSFYWPFAPRNWRTRVAASWAYWLRLFVFFPPPNDSPRCTSGAPTRFTFHRCLGYLNDETDVCQLSTTTIMQCKASKHCFLVHFYLRLQLMAKRIQSGCPFLKEVWSRSGRYFVHHMHTTHVWRDEAHSSATFVRLKSASGHWTTFSLLSAQSIVCWMGLIIERAMSSWSWS